MNPTESVYGKNITAKQILLVDGEGISVLLILPLHLGYLVTNPVVRQLLRTSQVAVLQADLGFEQAQHIWRARRAF